MVEAGAKEVSEAEILDALDIAHSEIKKLCEAQRELQQKAGKEKQEVEVPQVDEGLLEQITERCGAALNEATQVEDKLARQDDVPTSRARTACSERRVTFFSRPMYSTESWIFGLRGQPLRTFDGEEFRLLPAPGTAARS